jgi:hypothetical protein
MENKDVEKINNKLDSIGYGLGVIADFLANTELAKDLSESKYERFQAGMKFMSDHFAEKGDVNEVIEDWPTDEETTRHSIRILLRSYKAKGNEDKHVEWILQTLGRI